MHTFSYNINKYKPILKRKNPMSNINLLDLIDQKRQVILEINENALFYFLKGLYDLANLTKSGFIIYEAAYNHSAMYKVGLVNCSEDYFSDQINKPPMKQFDNNNFVILNLDSLQHVMSLVKKKRIEDRLPDILPALSFVNEFNLMKKPDDTNFYDEFKNFVLAKKSIKKLRTIDSNIRVIFVSEENFNYDFKNLFSSDEQFARFEKFLIKSAVPTASSSGRSLKV